MLVSVRFFNADKRKEKAQGKQVEPSSLEDFQPQPDPKPKKKDSATKTVKGKATSAASQTNYSSLVPGSKRQRDSTSSSEESVNRDFFYLTLSRKACYEKEKE